MSEPKFDREEDPDSESMFDFLAEEGSRPRARKSHPASKGERQLPVIRKPVPVSESGPLLPPKPGDPVDPPPQLTISKGDDFDFLSDEPPARAHTAESHVSNTVTQLQPDHQQSSKTQQDDSAEKTWHEEDERTKRMPAERTPAARMPAARMPAASNDHSLRHDPGSNNDDLDFDDLGLDDEFEFDRDWRNGVHTEVDYEEEPNSAGRKRLLALAVFLIAAGVGSFAFTQRTQWWPAADNADLTAGQAADAPDFVTSVDAVLQNEASSQDSSRDTGVSKVPGVGSFSITTSPLMQRFREQLAALEVLVADGSLDEAEQALASMDRTVYGYGAFEFGEIEVRIANIRNGVVAETRSGDVAENTQAQTLEQEKLAQQVADAETQRLKQERLAQQAADADAQRLEQERLAQQAADAEAQRLEQERLAQQAADAEAQRLEQENLAQQAADAEAQRLEQESLAQQAADAEARRLEQESLAQQAADAEAQRLEQERVAREAAAAEAQRLEQERLDQQAAAAETQRVEQERVAQQSVEAEAQRLEQEKLAEQANANSQVVDADRRATDRRIAEERAAAQRREARERRLTQARARADAQSEREQVRQEQAAVAAAQSARAVASAATDTESNSQTGESTDTQALTNQAITDEDLQIVYKRFVTLQQAVNSRDINTVIELTQRSGTRVQQFLQMFENSVSIESRIRNVSTRNAAGEIHGTLQINGVTRADGSVIKPPANVASISLTSKRDGPGWSAIRW